MDIRFDGTANASNFRLSIRISPEQFDINGLFHDRTVGPNHWSDESPIQGMADEDGPKEPGLLSDIAYGVLDVVGLVPVVGELGDGANALFYLAEGNQTDATPPGNFCRGCQGDGFLPTYLWQSPKFWQSL